MATVPVDQTPVPLAAPRPEYQNAQVPSAAFGAEQAAGLQKAGDQLQGLSTDLGNAALQNATRQAAVGRARDLGTYGNNAQSLWQTTATQQDITNPATVQQYGQQLNDNAAQMVQQHAQTYGAASAAALAERLQMQRTQMLSVAQSQSNQAQDKLVNDTVGTQLQPLAAAAYQNPGNLQQYIAASDGVVKDAGPALGTANAVAMTNTGRQIMVKAAITSLIDHNQLDQATAMVNNYGGSAGILSPDTTLALQSHITAAQVAQARVVAQSQANPFGTGLTGKAMNDVDNLATGFATGNLSPADETKFQSAVSILQRPQTVVDPDTGAVVQKVVPLPPVVTQAYAQRGIALPASAGAAVLPQQGGATTPSPGNAASAAPAANASPAQAPAAAGGTTPTGHPTIWALNQRGLVQGIIPGGLSAAEGIPGVGGMVPGGDEMTQARTYVETQAQNLANALSNTNLAGSNRPEQTAEYKQLGEDIVNKLNPGNFKSSAQYESDLIAIDDSLAEKEQELQDRGSRSGAGAQLAPAEIQQARQLANQIQNFRDIAGVPPKLTPAQYKAAAPGTQFRSVKTGQVLTKPSAQ